MKPVSQFLVIIAELILLGAFGEFIFRKTGIPDVIWLVIRNKNGRRRQVTTQEGPIHRRSGIRRRILVTKK